MQLYLASQSPRRRELLDEAGYAFKVIAPREWAECGVCSNETPPELVARLAYQKAHDVAERIDDSGVVIGCDTVVECVGQILGKPRNYEHARQMLHLLRGREHHVYSGLCLWCRPGDETHVAVDVTRLRMEQLPDDDIENYLKSGAWEGKAGAFGLQDRLGWIQIIEGSESNVVGLPLELLARMWNSLPEGCRPSS
jgi:septum formation protein